MSGDLKHEVIGVPQDVKEASRFVAQMGKEKRAIERLETKLNKDIEDRKEKAKEKIEPHEKRLAELMQGLYVYAEGHRKELTKDGNVKTVTLPSGKFLWRLGNRTVQVTDAGEAIKSIKERGLAKKLIKTVETVIKSAVKKEKDEVVDSLKGVAITQAETFRVEPNKTSVIDAEVKDLKRKV